MRKMHGLSGKPGVIQDVMVAEQDAFGKTGGPRGVLNVDRIVPIQSVRHPFELIRRDVPGFLEYILPDRKPFIRAPGVFGIEGIIFIFVVLFFRGGIAGFVESLRRRLKWL